MARLFTTLILTLISLAALAQSKNGSVRGVAFDTISRQPVAGATVTVVEKKDSSLVSFTMTDNAGRFQVTGLANGAYRLLITHVNYHNSNTLFTITDDKKNVDLTQVRLSDRSKVLEEVVVSNEAPPVTLVGDTVQYNAGSFKVQPNASVEQLLKKLPGVKVEKDGTVKAQGETVRRVLVDGKEFFGDDPKVATKNLPADAVDKVQVYDRQSEQAQLTGFEDGNYEKTINLKLKKDKKKGVFGKVTAGGGDQGRYEGRFNVNSFKGARQMSAIGMANNTNAEGFSFMDILNFTGELARMQRGAGSGGNININISADDASALGLGGNSNGINTARAGGVNYNDIIGTRVDLQSNYFYGRYNPDIQRQISRQNLSDKGSSYYDEQTSSNNLNNSHRLNLNALYQIDSTTSLRIIPSLNLQDTRNRSASAYQTRTDAGSLINEGQSDNYTRNSGYNFRNELMFRKKFRRKGRTFSLSLQTSFNESDGDGRLQSLTRFYNNGILNSIDTINQQSSNSASLRGYTARAVYTEPLMKRSLMEFSVSQSNTRNKSELSTFDYDRLSSKFDKVNTAQTKDYNNDFEFVNAGMRLRTQLRKFSFSYGLAWQLAQLRGTIISGVKDSVITKTFRNLLPTARFQFNFTRFKSLSLVYTTATNQPSMAQLQPVPDLTNRLYVRYGNPGLKQEFTHNLQANLNLVSPYKNRNFFALINFQSAANRIVNNDSISQQGIRYSTPVNVSGVYNLNTNLMYSMPVRFLKGSVELGSRTGTARTRQFVNAVANTIHSFSLGPSVRFDMNPSEKLNISLDGSINFNSNRYSVQSNLNARYMSQEYSTSLFWTLPARLNFETDFTYTVNNRLANGYNVDIPLWNAAISKMMLRYNRGQLRLSVADLLNKNTAVRRSANQNYIEDSRVNTLKRFFLLTFTYSLTRTGLPAGGSSDVRVIRR